jgi:hypothetical protein
MVGRPWTTPAQKLYLETMLASYLAVDELPNNGKALGRFWVVLNEEFFRRFPEPDAAKLKATKDVSLLQSTMGIKLTRVFL